MTKKQSMKKEKRINWIDEINNAPKWAWTGIKWISEKENRSLKSDNFPTIGEVIIGIDNNGPGQDEIIHLPQPKTQNLKVLEIQYQCIYPADSSGFGSMDERKDNLQGIPIRIFIGTKYTGIILQYNHSDASWFACFSHGNFGKKYASGGNWGCLVGMEQQSKGQDCKVAFGLRKENSALHTYTKSEIPKKEKYMLSADFWSAVEDDLKILGLI